MSIIDVHVHFGGSFGTTDADADVLAAAARRWGVARLVLSALSVRPGELSRRPSRAVVRACNAVILCQMSRHPDVFLGFCYLNPEHGASFCRSEMDRCIVQGRMVGVKLLTAVPADDRKVDAVAAHSAALRVPILHHAWYNWRGQGPNESTPAHLARLAARHPGTTFIMAHLVGCNRRGLQEIAPFPNVLVDTCGGDVVAGFVEEAVRRLGPGRVVYGSDTWCRGGRNLPKQIARVTGARVPASVRDAVLGGNALRVLRRAPHARALGLFHVPSLPSPLRHAGKVGPLIDVCCYAGTYPYNTILSATPARLERDLAREGVVQAFVSPMEALTDQETEAGNERLMKEIAGSRLLRPAPAVNPTHGNWPSVLARAAGSWRAKMVRILPAYHGYALECGPLAPFIRACAKAELVLAVQLRIEDDRTQNPRAFVADVPFAQAVSLARAFPEARFLLCGVPRNIPADVGLDRVRNVWLEISNLESPDALALAMAHVPVSRLVHGTHAPFYVPRAAQALLYEAPLSEAARERVACGNARVLLGDRRRTS